MTDKMHPASDDPATYPVDEAYERRLDNDPNLLHSVCWAGRPGTAIFARKLELEHFRPCTRDNDNFNVMIRNWQGMQWAVISIPTRYRAVVDECADDVGMRLADGFPHVITNGRAEAFTMRSKNVWTLENKPGSMLYDGALAIEQLIELVQTKIRDIERRHYAWVDTLDTVYHRGRNWHLLKTGDVLPAGVVDEMKLGEHRGKPTTWYTIEPRIAGWTPYPK